MKNNDLLISDYNYPLPEERIAKFPLEKREMSKLLIYNKGNISESQFYHIGEYLPQGSMLVFNNTKVIRARLIFHKPTGARIEITNLLTMNVLLRSKVLANGVVLLAISRNGKRMICISILRWMDNRDA